MGTARTFGRRQRSCGRSRLACRTCRGSEPLSAGGAFAGGGRMGWHEAKPVRSTLDDGYRVGGSGDQSLLAAWTLIAGFICLVVSVIAPAIGELIHRADHSGYLNRIFSLTWLFIVIFGPALTGIALWKGSTFVRVMAIVVLVLQMPLFLRGASRLLGQ